MPNIEAIGSRRSRQGAVALERRDGATSREIHFEIYDDVQRNALSLMVFAMEPIAWVGDEDPMAPSDRTAWSFHISRLTVEQHAWPGLGIHFWQLMRREFDPITPTLIQAAVMRAYVRLWPRLFSTRPPRSVELDLNQMGIFDVGIFAGSVHNLQRGWDPGFDDRTIHSVRAEAREEVLQRVLASEMIGRQIAKDAHDDPVKALAAPSSKLPVYRPR